MKIGPEPKPQVAPGPSHLLAFFPRDYTRCYLGEGVRERETEGFVNGASALGS